MEQLLKKHAQKIRFLFVGGGVSVLDFVILFALTFAGMDKFIANYISTGISMVVSFFVNKSFTFKNTSKTAKRQFVLFIVVTITGLWALQPLVIWVVTSGLAPFIASDEATLFIAKVIATGASLVWNYLLYSRLVFKKESTTS